jgi:hypothetical protein
MVGTAESTEKPSAVYNLILAFSRLVCQKFHELPDDKQLGKTAF